MAYRFWVYAALFTYEEFDYNDLTLVALYYGKILSRDLKKKGFVCFYVRFWQLSICMFSSVSLC